MMFDKCLNSLLALAVIVYAGVALGGVKLPSFGAALAFAALAVAVFNIARSRAHK